MKIKSYIEKLNNSEAYKKFEKQYSDSFMIAGFFILDFETSSTLHQIDYYVPSEKKIAAFTLDGKIAMQMLDMINHKIVPEKLDIKMNIDLDALHGILEDEMKNRSITEEIKKIIAIVQSIDGKKIWNLNCVLSGMGILKAHIDDESQTILKMEKASLLDYVKKMPVNPAHLKEMQGMPGMENSESEEPKEESRKESKEDLKEKIKTLDKLDKEIEAEKRKTEEELAKKDKISKKEEKEEKK